MRATEGRAEHDVESRLKIGDDEASHSLERMTVGEDAQRQLELAARLAHCSVSVLYTLPGRLHLALQVVLAHVRPRDKVGFRSRVPQASSRVLIHSAAEEDDAGLVAVDAELVTRGGVEHERRVGRHHDQRSVGEADPTLLALLGRRRRRRCRSRRRIRRRRGRPYARLECAVRSEGWRRRIGRAPVGYSKLMVRVSDPSRLTVACCRAL